MAETTRRAPRKTAPASTAAKKAAATRAVPRDEPIGRFAALRAEVLQDPYEVTATLRIEPPDKNRASMIMAAQTAYAIARGQLEALMRPLPDPTQPDGIAKDEGGGPLLPKVDTKQLEKLRDLVNESAEEYDKALFGDAYDEIIEYFKFEQGGVWNAFYSDVQDTFMPVPDDGVCPTCGHAVNEEQAGKPDESSTSSSTTGTT